MIHLDEIHSLSQFQRNAKKFLRHLKKTRRPAVLTVNGKAELVVQDAASYQQLLDQLEKLEAMEGIRKGLESMEKGQGLPLVKALEDVRRRLNLPPGAWSTKSE